MLVCITFSVKLFLSILENKQIWIMDLSQELLIIRGRLHGISHGTGLTARILKPNINNSSIANHWTIASAPYRSYRFHNQQTSCFLAPENKL